MYSKSIITAVCFFITSFTFAQTTKTAKDHYNDGIKLQDTEKYTEALAAFKKAIAKDPNYKEAIYYAGWTSNELKKYSEALTFLQKAKLLWPGEPKVHLELGYAYENLNKRKDAVDCYNKCLALDDEYSLAHKYLGILYYDNYEYKNALESLNAYLELMPNSTDEDVYYRKAVSENELGNYTDALASITKATTLKPNSVKFLNEVAYTHYSLTNAEEALKYYDRSLAIDPKSLTALNGRAEVYRKLKKNTAEAIKLFNKTLEIDPKNTKANYWIGWCYNELGKYNDAVPYLKKVIVADPQYVSAYTELGYCDYALKNYDDALINFKKAFAIEKTELNLYYTGLCYIGKKDRSSALQMVNDLKAMSSEYAEDLQKSIDKM